MNKRTISLLFVFLVNILSYGQNVGSSSEYIKALTADWEGERFHSLPAEA